MWSELHWSVQRHTEKFGGTILLEGFQSNPALDSVNKVDSFFVLLRFHFLLQLYIALTAFWKVLWVWVSELAWLRWRHRQRTLPFLLLQYWWDFLGDVYQLYWEVCWISSLFLGLPEISVQAIQCTWQIELEPCESTWWILRPRLILPLKWTLACRFSRNGDSHSTYLLFSPFPIRVLMTLCR